MAELLTIGAAKVTGKDVEIVPGTIGSAGSVGAVTAELPMGVRFEVVLRINGVDEGVLLKGATCQPLAGKVNTVQVRARLRKDSLALKALANEGEPL